MICFGFFLKILFQCFSVYTVYILYTSFINRTKSHILKDKAKKESIKFFDEKEKSNFAYTSLHLVINLELLK